MPNKTHYRNIRLKVNAGLNFPQCQAHREILDMSKTGWRTSTKWSEVGCAHCLKDKGKRSK